MWLRPWLRMMQKRAVLLFRPHDALPPLPCSPQTDLGTQGLSSLHSSLRCTAAPRSANPAVQLERPSAHRPPCMCYTCMLSSPYL